MCQFGVSPYLQGHMAESLPKLMVCMSIVGVQVGTHRPAEQHGVLQTCPKSASPSKLAIKLTSDEHHIIHTQ
jgi:hypothetical protein